ncbi:MAG: glycosyl transferase, partial [Anaerolineae bacterium]
MSYGYFDDESREYVITDPRTPVRWINYVGTLDFGGFVDQTGGALICQGDPALNRITYYLAGRPHAAFNGTSLYLRLREGDGYRLFSPFYVPTLDPWQHYECRVGLGYTRILSLFYGLRTEATIFVPPGQRRLVHDIRVTNLSAGTVEVEAIPVVEYTHFDALRQLTNADWVPQTMQSRAHTLQDGTLVLTQYAFMRRDTAVNYFTADRPARSFETDRERFLGDNGYGTWAAPLSLQQDDLDDYEANRGNNVAALLIPLGALPPGGTARLVTQLGQAPDLESALPGIRAFQDTERVDDALAELARFWDETLSRCQVETPDPGLDRMLNVYNPRQCYITLNWSRYLSLYQLGFGARGIGFRDSAQDAMGVVGHAPDRVRALLEKLLQVQRRDGSAMHQFNPLTMVASAGDAREMEDRPGYYGDDHLWIVLAVAAYLKETGDLAFLEQEIAYYEKDAREVPLESGTVLDHLRRAVDFTRRDLGAHGLPLAGFADWNDTVNLPAGAESLFVANLYGRALGEMIDLARHLGDEAAAARYAAYYEEMRARFEAHAWDGAWYRRYFDAEGQPLGSAANRHGQIYANAQSWPVLSGFA